MTDHNLDNEVKPRLLLVMSELKTQEHLSEFDDSKKQSLKDELQSMEQDINVGDEYEIAYASLVPILEHYPFALSNKAALALLELGLLFGYKTRFPKDALFNRKQDKAHQQ